MSHYSHLQAFLETILPPEQVTVIVESFELLLKCGIDGQDYQIQQELALAEDGDNNTTIQSIYNLVVPLMVLTLRQFGVTCSPEAPLDDLRDILAGIVSLENYGDPTTIVQFCDNAEGPEESLCEILTFVGKGSIGHYLGLIEDVDPKLLERIETTCMANYTEEPADMPMLEEIRTRLRPIIKYLGAENCILVLDVRAGQKLGLPLIDYLQPHEEELEALAKDKNNLPALVRQLLAFVYASNTPTGNVSEAVMNELDTLIDDKAWLGSANVVLGNLLEELNHA